MLDAEWPTDFFLIVYHLLTAACVQALIMQKIEVSEKNLMEVQQVKSSVNLDMLVCAS